MDEIWHVYKRNSNLDFVDIHNDIQNLVQAKSCKNCLMNITILRSRCHLKICKLHSFVFRTNFCLWFQCVVDQMDVTISHQIRRKFSLTLWPTSAPAHVQQKRLNIKGPGNQKQWSSYDTNPNFMHHYKGKTPKLPYLCCLFESPKLCN